MENLLTLKRAPLPQIADRFYAPIKLSAPNGRRYLALRSFAEHENSSEVERKSGKLQSTLEMLSLAHARNMAELSLTLVVIGHGMGMGRRRERERGLFTYLAKMWEREERRGG